MQYTYGKYEIRPCRNTTDGRCEVEEVSPNKAQFWGIYEAVADGRMMWVADFDTQDEALAYVKAFTSM